MSHRLQVSVTLSGFGLGLITIYGPTWLFLRHLSGLRRDAFLKIYPQKRPLVIGYNVIAFLNLLIIGPLLGISLGNAIAPSMQPFFLYCCWSNSIGIVNGTFEWLTAICPKRGIHVCHTHKQVYLYHPSVRKVGLGRLGLGVFLIGVCRWLSLYLRG
jgi:hypothetical protein